MNGERIASFLAMTFEKRLLRSLQKRLRMENRKSKFKKTAFMINLQIRIMKETSVVYNSNILLFLEGHITNNKDE